MKVVRQSGGTRWATTVANNVRIRFHPRGHEMSVTHTTTSTAPVRQRPHTAAGTSKASGDAVSLAQHLQAANFDLSHALALWQTERLAVAQRLIHHGWQLARNSGLGK